MRPPAIEAFIACLSEIAPSSDQPITPQSHLIEDLGFEGLAFGRLGLLVYERYGIGGLSTVSLRSENLTVEGFFEHCILHVLGIGPETETTELSAELPDLVFRPFCLADAEALMSWASSPDELLQWSGPHFRFPLDEKQLRDYVASADENRHLISGVSSGSDAVLAHAELNVLPDHELGQIRRVAVAPEARGKGIGTELMRWLADFAFMELRLHRLELVVFSFNKRARRCYEAAGFTVEGYARDARRASRGYWDLVYMARLSR